MDREETIKEIIKFQPKSLNETGDIPREGAIAYHQLIAKFGQYYYGIGERWYWFTKTEMSNPLRNPEHSFLEDATDDELNELILLLKNQ